MTRRGHASKIDEQAHHRAAETRPQPCFSGNTRDLDPQFWCMGLLCFRDHPDMLSFGYFCPDYRLTCASVQVQCIYQKLPCLASKKSRFNYPKMGYYPFVLLFLIIYKRDQNTVQTDILFINQQENDNNAELEANQFCVRVLIDNTFISIMNL